MPFVVSYITYRYAVGTWHLLVRREPGFWEAGEDFPEGKFR